MSSKKMPTKKRRNKSKTNKIRGLSLQIIPFSEINGLSITERIKKILKLILGNKVIILQGRLRVEEEIRLIEDTMAMVDHIKSFRGIELAVIEPDMKDAGILGKMKQNLANRLTGGTNALTIIGPATIVKEIKKDPRKLEVMF